VNTFIQELFHSGIYKRTQGRITRQVTWAAMAVVLALGLYRLDQTVLIGLKGPALRYGIGGVLLIAGLWIAYRIVNLPMFADFLIAVEAEMNKVSWPTRGELFRGAVVVLIVIGILAMTLFGFDIAWGWFFKLIRVL
jgi:preprotein translocase subunit SecE